MTTYQDLKDFFQNQNLKVIIAADAETRVSQRKNGDIISKIAAGGVSIALDPIARAAGALYISRGKTEDEKKIASEKGNKIIIEDQNGNYTLKRLFFSQEEINSYYYGFSNQILWPLCHVAFEKPEFNREWLDGFRSVNQKFAQAIKEEVKEKSFIWINDYQLCLVPHYLEKPKDSVVGFFWHIPWPTWEIFRILPFKQEILESLLQCDFIAFHRGYHARNFLETVEREVEAKIDEERDMVYFNKHAVTVKNLPLGIDADVIHSLIHVEQKETFLTRTVKSLLHFDRTNGTLDEFFDKHAVIIGVDRLDYTKGLILRLYAIERFFQKYPKFIGKVSYLGIIAPSREAIPSYGSLHKQVRTVSEQINVKFAKDNWKPINITYEVFPRKDIVNFYRKSQLCLVTPRDDGMNLVSKEFVIASSYSKNPGMLVLSRFAGSAIDLTQALIVNPYDIEEVADAIKKGLTMSKKEKKDRIQAMAETLEERNIYEWGKEFVRSALSAAKESKKL